MKRACLILIVVMILLASCSQDYVQVYTTTIENRSRFILYCGIRRSTDTEAYVLDKIMPFCQHHLLMKKTGEYYVDFARYNANGEVVNEGSFSIENPLKIEKIVFTGRTNTLLWKIIYKE